MTLKRQLLLVSLLALMLPWAGCEFIRETESALRVSQQQMLAGTARALAETLSTMPEEFPPALDSPSEQIFLHDLVNQPEIDGHFDDWLLTPDVQRSIRGTDGSIRIAMGLHGHSVYLFARVRDDDIVYASADALGGDSPPADRIAILSSSPPYLEERIEFRAEAPGRIIGHRLQSREWLPDVAIDARWEALPRGYQLEARIPIELIGTHLGLTVYGIDAGETRAVPSATFSGSTPPPLVIRATGLQDKAAQLVQKGLRTFITDRYGWRIAAAGQLSDETTQRSGGNNWSAVIYNLVVESGEASDSAEPGANGRELQPYVGAALSGREMAAWFRSDESGRAIVAVATPIQSDGEILGALVLQQGTDAILSTTNAGLARLINVTLITTLLVAGALIAYASWLSRRIRELSVAAELALENESLQTALPSALANDEIGDLSRGFSHVLRQLDEYNAYLQTLASKLSHELRTPLAIVTSSLDNLEQEGLDEAAAGYTIRAKEGAERLRGILAAMSEASRVEEIMKNADTEVFDLAKVLGSTVDAYRDVYSKRTFEFVISAIQTEIQGSPELLIQMLDKLVDNAVDFSQDNDEITISLDNRAGALDLYVRNPGPPLPNRMQSQLFDSMVSLRNGENTRHLGLGLYVAKLIAEGHRGRIHAENVNGGVQFCVSLPLYDSR